MTSFAADAADGDRSGGGQSSRSGSAPAVGEVILHCRTVATGQFRQRHHVRDLPPFGDEAQEDASVLHRDGVAPDPSEVLLSALGSCLSISIHANAVARAIPIRKLEIELKGTINRSALWGTRGQSPRALGFEAISIRVHVEADVPVEVLKSLVDQAVLWSPVANTFHDPVHLDVELA